MDFWIAGEVLFCERQVAGIDDDSEVGTATEFVGGVNGPVETLVEMRAERSGEMGTRGKAEDTDALRIDFPFAGMGAHESEGALRVLESGGGLGERARIGDTILEKDAGDMNDVEPIADFCTFKVDSENAVSASGENNNRSAGRIFFCSKNSECGMRNVAEADERFAGDEVVLRSRGVHFGRRVCWCPRSSVRPNFKSEMAGRRLPGRLLSALRSWHGEKYQCND